MKPLTLLLALLAMASVDHTIQVATFTLYQAEGKIKLDVNMSISDISHALESSSTRHTLQSLEEFLNDQTAFTFDGQRKRLKVNSTELKEDHLIIQSEFEGNIPSISTLEIHNTCLLSIEDHSNIIEIRINQQERDFLMNSKRTNIKVQL